MKMWKKAIAGLTLGLGVVLSSGAQAEKLQIQTFNPGSASLFPVSSTLVTGPTEAVLIDAQFQRNDAQALLKMIRATGKPLKTIYISHGDPDFYFGLDVIMAAYPGVRVLASPATVAHIKKTVDKKISYWGPILGQNAPQKTVMPEVLSDNSLTVDGKKLKIVGLDGHDPKHSFVWIPSLKMVTGGVVVYENVHVWMADAKTPDARANWRRTLDDLLALKPARIIPGHVIGTSAENRAAVAFTRSYIDAFEQEAANAAGSADLVTAMKKRFPAFTNLNDLTLSAKVVMGEIPWP